MIKKEGSVVAAYFGARYYEQNIGRFNQTDPVSLLFYDNKQLKEKTGKTLNKLLENPQVLNNYSYVINNPLKYNDPNGEWFKEFFTFRQSWSSFQAEIGQATMCMGSTWQTAMDHPYITGAAVGVAGGLAAVAGSAVLGQGGLTLLRAAPLAGPVITNVGREFNKLNRAASNAYNTAASGGQHSGIITNITKNNMTISNIQKSIRSLQNVATKHLNYIKDPSTYSKYDEFVTKTIQQQQNTLNKWYGEAVSYIEQAQVYQGVLNEILKNQK